MTEPIDTIANPELSIFNVMQIVMDTINSVFSEYDVDLPARQFFEFGGMGDVVHDSSCGQLTVSFEQMYNGLPGQQEQSPSRCNSPRTGVFVVELVRCTPTPKTGRNNAPRPPTVEEQNASALRQVTDAWLLMEGGMRAVDVIGFTGGLADVSAGDESGGVQATILSLIVGIP